MAELIFQRLWVFAAAKLSILWLARQIHLVFMFLPSAVFIGIIENISTRKLIDRLK